MRRLLVSLLLVVLAVPLGAGVPYRDSTQADGYLRAGPFPTVEAFFEAAGAREILAAGATYDAERDPDGLFSYLWAIAPDSSAWIQSPAGDMMLIDPVVLWIVGEQAAQRVGYEKRDMEGVGYGWEDGRLYLYLTQSAPVWWVLGLSVVALAAGGLGVARLVRNLGRSRARERELAESRRRIVDSREDERLGLSRDLHDGPLQDLQTLRMQLGVAEHAVASGEPLDLLRTRVSGVQDELLRVIGEVRQIAEGLRPPVLSSFGLAPALRAHVKRLQAQTEARIHVSAQDEGDTLPEATRLTLYRVAQESLRNALAHGAPATVTVAFRRDAGAAHLTVEDDGRGFVVPSSLHAFERDGHLGLAGMAERAEALGGTLAVRSSAAGTRIHMSIPLAASPAATP